MIRATIVIAWFNVACAVGLCIARNWQPAIASGAIALALFLLARERRENEQLRAALHAEMLARVLDGFDEAERERRTTRPPPN